MIDAKAKRHADAENKTRIDAVQRANNKIRWALILGHDLEHRPLPLTYEIGDKNIKSADPEGAGSIVREILAGKGYKISVTTGGWSGGILTIQ